MEGLRPVSALHGWSGACFGAMGHIGRGSQAVAAVSRGSEGCFGPIQGLSRGISGLFSAFSGSSGSEGLFRAFLGPGLVLGSSWSVFGLFRGGVWILSIFMV